jgi:hypothetical protein
MNESGDKKSKNLKELKNRKISGKSLSALYQKVRVKAGWVKVFADFTLCFVCTSGSPSSDYR